MRNTLVSLLVCLMSLIGFAQETHTVNGTSVTMEAEVEGPMSLYVSKENYTYRYFIAKGDTFYELVNTQDASGTYQFEYKAVLKEQTSDVELDVNIERTTLTITSLKKVVLAYNRQKDTSYVYENKHFQLGLNLGIMGGVSNNVFTSNPENVMAPQVIAELEAYNALNPASGHSAFLHLKQNFTADDFDYTATELSVNYRYKVVNKDAFKLYGQAKIFSFAYKSYTNYYVVDNAVESYEEDGLDVDIPVSFGFGADVKISNSLFLTFQYTDIVAVFYESNGEFPVDLNLGLKFKL
ncbi:hypothetical protein [Neptunitalea lumnitzerae]|nr:hypothetical protein [Neptunitalea sp. Y10]